MRKNNSKFKFFNKKINEETKLGKTLYVLSLKGLYNDISEINTPIIRNKEEKKLAKEKVISFIALTTICAIITVIFCINEKNIIFKYLFMYNTVLLMMPLIMCIMHHFVKQSRKAQQIFTILLCAIISIAYYFSQLFLAFIPRKIIHKIYFFGLMPIITSYSIFLAIYLLNPIIVNTNNFGLAACILVFSSYVICKVLCFGTGKFVEKIEEEKRGKEIESDISKIPSYAFLLSYFAMRSYVFLTKNAANNLGDSLVAVFALVTAAKELKKEINGEKGKEQKELEKEIKARKEADVEKAKEIERLESKNEELDDKIKVLEETVAKLAKTVKDKKN